VWSSTRSLRRIIAARGDLTGTGSALIGLVAGLLGLTALVVGTGFWFLTS
jgi:hypothetical protein